MNGARESDKPMDGDHAIARSILAIVPFPMMVIDDCGILRSSNHHAEILFGFDGKTAPGQNINELIPQLYHHIHDRTIAEYAGSLDGERIAQSRVFMARHRDGYEIPVAALVSKVVIEGQRVFACSLQTLSDWLGTGAHAAQASERDANAIGSDDTVALLVHELNQPMTAMTNFLAAAQIALMAGSSPETITGFVKDASAQSLRARDLLQRLRTIFED
ncbi:MAG: PAS domain S-box protein [Pseudomonadota bacterium]|uniref:PAS domain S-box protein n=1 Tax=uncultured Sphingomonas sp. TaxID=158754 RepID=UPI0030F6B696